MTDSLTASEMRRTADTLERVAAMTDEFGPLWNDKGRRRLLMQRAGLLDEALHRELVTNVA